MFDMPLDNLKPPSNTSHLQFIFIVEIGIRHFIDTIVRSGTGWASVQQRWIEYRFVEELWSMRTQYGFEGRIFVVRHGGRGRRIRFYCWRYDAIGAVTAIQTILVIVTIGLGWWMRIQTVVLMCMMECLMIEENMSGLFEPWQSICCA